MVRCAHAPCRSAMHRFEFRLSHPDRRGPCGAASAGVCPLGLTSAGRDPVIDTGPIIPSGEPLPSILGQGTTSNGFGVGNHIRLLPFLDRKITVREIGGLPCPSACAQARQTPEGTRRRTVRATPPADRFVPDAPACGCRAANSQQPTTAALPVFPQHQRCNVLSTRRSRPCNHCPPHHPMHAPPYHGGCRLAAAHRTADQPMTTRRRQPGAASRPMARQSSGCVGGTASRERNPPR